jgi:hypothetical protein
MKALFFFACIHCFIFSAAAQDTTIVIDNSKVLMREVIVRNNFDYTKVLQHIKTDTSFYKAFKNLRILNYTSFNDIKMMDKKGKLKASLFSKTRQSRSNNCRTMDVLEEKVTGNFYTTNHDYTYLTAQLYASLFFTKGTICGENNTVGNKRIITTDKTGIEKHKEQLKMLFFNPGKKIPGIPFIGDKLDLYDERAKKLYDYRLDIEEYKGSSCYVFTIVPKENLGSLKDNNIVVDGMVTWFDNKTLEVLKRNYSLSYKAGLYDFNVSMEVEMARVGNMVVPTVLRYKGNWDVVFKQRERGEFTATLFNFSEEKN